MTSPLEPAERPADDRRLARVPGHLAGARLDRFLAEHFPSWSRRQLMDAIREGHVKVNGRKARPGQRVEAGDELDLPVWSKHFADVDKRPRRSGPDMRATSEVRVLHRDETLLVVDKPAGMAVHGGAGPGRATILDALRESGGFAIAVDDDAIVAGLEEVSKTEGFLMCPEGAATYAAWKKALAGGLVSPDETAVLFNCASGLKYELPRADDALDCTGPIDYGKLVAAHA